MNKRYGHASFYVAVVKISFKTGTVDLVNKFNLLQKCVEPAPPRGASSTRKGGL